MGSVESDTASTGSWLWWAASGAFVVLALMTGVVAVGLVAGTWSVLLSGGMSDQLAETPQTILFFVAVGATAALVGASNVYVITRHRPRWRRWTLGIASGDWIAALTMFVMAAAVLGGLFR